MSRVVDFCPSEEDDLPDVSTIISKPREQNARASPVRRALVPKSATKSTTRKIRRLETNNQLKGNLLFQRADTTEEKRSESPRRSPLKAPSFAPKTPGKGFPNRSLFDDDSDSPPPTVRTARKQIANRSIFDEETPPAARTVRARKTKITTIVEDEISESESSPDVAVDHLLQTPAIRRERAEKAKEAQITQDEIDMQEAEAQLLQEASVFSFGSEQSSLDASGLGLPPAAPSAAPSALKDGSDSSELSSIDEVEEQLAKDVSQVSEVSTTGDSEEGSANSSVDEPSDYNEDSGSYNGSDVSMGDNDTSSASFASEMPTNRVQEDRSQTTAHVDILKPRDANLLSSSPNASPRPQRASALPESDFDLAVHLSKLRLEPPSAQDQENRPSTPPQTPSKSAPPKGLASPSKRAPLIPKTPHRPSVDTFWSQDFVNDWNDEHSPRKPALPSSSVMKSPSKPSPKKEVKKDFDSKKHAIAETFFRELDERITDGKIAELSESTGGVKLVWSKTLNTTAGRANWKRETIRRKKVDGTELDVKYNHHASMELAEKVIDNEERLLNVVAHEFCHLANFMVTGITNNPHGKEFKAWATKTTKVFSDRAVKVTTKHTYEIDYRYIWSCEECTSEYKRHSKSIDPQRHRCGSCKGMLKQIKPTPRGSGKPSEYQAFVKEQMKVVKLENPGIAPKEVMKVVAAKWAAKKGAATAGKEAEAEVEAKVEMTVTEDSLAASVVDLTLDV